MRKEIKFGSYSASPSGRECQDGDFDIAINAALDDGLLRPLPQPVTILNCGMGGKVLTIHHVPPTQENYIIARPERDDPSVFGLYWLKRTQSLQSEADATLIAKYTEITDIAIIGNTLTLATSDGVRHILWKENDYRPLPSRPPFVDISFGMTQASILSDVETLSVHFDNVRADTYRPDWSQENSDAVYGMLFSSINDNITSKGFFYMPFFVRYAYRLYDGTYLWHSAPVLMLPSVIPPIIVVNDNYNVQDGIGKVETTLELPYFSLDYRIISDNEDLSKLLDWKDLIASIDVFVTPQIYTYDQSERVKSISNLRWHLLNAYYDWNPDGMNPRDTSISQPDKVFVGHYSDNTSRGAGDGAENTGTFVDHFRTVEGTAQTSVWVIPTNKNFHSQIKSASNFYKVATLEINSMTAMAAYKRLPLTSEDIRTETLNTRTPLPEEYLSHSDLTPQHLLAFNSRLNMANVALAPPKPFSLISSVAATTPINPAGYARIKVFSRHNGTLCFSLSEEYLPGNLWDLTKSFPRYIYYPDPTAYKMEISVGTTISVILDLVPHDFLNGAYWYGTFAENALPENAEAETAEAKSVSMMPNKIYTSEVNNPFLFPATGINTVGSGTIIGISSAAKALSQGQFGQFPLYAFCSDGIWALETGSTGAFTARQPISRDVCTSKQGITQIDSAVLFPSARGIMLLSGSSVKCISDSLRSPSVFAPSSLPGLGKLADGLGITLAHSAPSEPFVQYLSGCSMLYDYAGQRLVVFNMLYDYAYSYSFKDNAWGMHCGGLHSSVNAYPEAMAIDIGGNLVQFPAMGSQSSDESAATPVLLVTRPLKLDRPDVLKTVHEIFVRGDFPRGAVQTALYASRDLRNWLYVSSSADHALRRLRGTPYKYFRLALRCRLAPADSLFGCTVDFTPRMDNRLR